MLKVDQVELGAMESFVYYQVIDCMNNGKVTTGLSKEQADEESAASPGKIVHGPFIGQKWNAIAVKETDYMMASTQKEMLWNDIAECKSMIKLLSVSTLTDKLREYQYKLANLELQKRMIGSGDIIMPI